MNLWKTNHEIIAVIYSRADEGVDSRGKDVKGFSYPLNVAFSYECNMEALEG